MTFHDSDADWFLAQYKPNSHKIALRNLARQGFGTFLPMQEETRRVRGRFAVQMRPLFPGYLFVAFNAAKSGYHAVNATYGVTRLVSPGSVPAPVPRDLVRQLVLRCDSDGRLVPPEMLQPGDYVTLTKGPFTDFVATVESIEPDRRVWVLMSLMGAQTRVALEARHMRAN